MSAKEIKPSARLKKFLIATLVLVLCFSLPLYDLIRFAADDDLFSYILLIPVISVYLVWLQKKNLPHASGPATIWAAVFGTCGVAVMLVYWLTAPALWKAEEDYLAMNIFAFLLFFAGICSLFWGKEIMRANAFPLGLLIFMIPFPIFVTQGIETFLQHGSAAVAAAMLRLSGMPLYQDGLIFQLPGITLRVARECSGIHSSLVLFITSLLAGHLFLRTSWKRTTLALVVIPLALLRNGFRVFVIGQLCVQIGPEMIDSPIHRHGGPLFFILSLIPFFLLLFYLRKSERAGKPSSDQTSKT